MLIGNGKIDRIHRNSDLAYGRGGYQVEHLTITRIIDFIIQTNGL